MNRLAVAAIVAAVGVFAAVYYFARDPGEPAAVSTGAAPAATPSPAAERSKGAAPSAATPPLVSAAGDAPAVRPAVTDPRLAALMGSPGDDLVELVAGPDGRVIREIDVDPNSPGYRKPLREYAYAGDKVAMIVAYKYFGGQTQIIRAMATYKPDGSVDKYSEETRYEQVGQGEKN